MDWDGKMTGQFLAKTSVLTPNVLKPGGITNWMVYGISNDWLSK